MTPELLELLSRYLDDDLEPARRAAVERELERPEVARELERLRQLRAAVRRLAASEHPPRLLDRLVEPLRLAAPPRPPWRSPAALAAAAVIAAAAGLLAVLPREPAPAAVPAPRRARAEAPATSATPFVLGQTPRLEGAGRGTAERVAAARPEVPAPAGPPPPLEVEGPLPPGGSVLHLDGTEVPLPAAPPVAGPEPVEVEIRGGRVVDVRRAPAPIAPALEGLEVPGAADGVRRGTVEPVTPGRPSAGTDGR